MERKFSYEEQVGVVKVAKAAVDRAARSALDPSLSYDKIDAVNAADMGGSQFGHSVHDGLPVLAPRVHFPEMEASRNSR